MKSNIKTWSVGIGVVVTIILSISGYIYAESTCSRARDVKIMGYVVKEDTKLRSEIYTNQMVQMAILTDIKVAVGKVQTDVDHIKRIR